MLNFTVQESGTDEGGKLRVISSTGPRHYLMIRNGSTQNLLPQLPHSQGHCEASWH